MGWLKLLPALLRFLTWLGTVLLARKSGADEVKKDVAESNVEAAKRIAEASADAPSTKSAVLGRLSDPDRKL